MRERTAARRSRGQSRLCSHWRDADGGELSEVTVYLGELGDELAQQHPARTPFHMVSKLASTAATVPPSASAVADGGELLG